MALPCSKIVLDFNQSNLQKLGLELSKMFDERNEKGLVPEPSGTSFVVGLLEKAVKDWRRENEN